MKGEYVDDAGLSTEVCRGSRQVNFGKEPEIFGCHGSEDRIATIFSVETTTDPFTAVRSSKPLAFPELA
jgi:hypothetical protein